MTKDSTEKRSVVVMPLPSDPQPSRSTPIHPTPPPSAENRHQLNINNDSIYHDTSATDISSNAAQQQQQRLLFAGIVAGTVLTGTLALTAPFVLSRSPLPYMATPASKIRRALVFLNTTNNHHHHLHNTSCSSPSNSSIRNSLQNTPASTATTTTTSTWLQSPHSSPKQQQQPRIFVDLGSGDGEAVYQAARSGYYDQAVGVELNYTLWILSCIRRNLFWSRQERQRSVFLSRNFLQSKQVDDWLRCADCVMIFGVKPLMEPISRKLARECKIGTHILSYRFQLPLQTEDGHENNGLLNAELIYNEEEMRIYRMKR